MAHEAVLVTVATNPFQLSDEQVAALSFGTKIEKTVNQVSAGCQRQCALGGELCRLSLTAEAPEEGSSRGSAIEVSGSCTDCPNPAVAQMAVGSLVDFADRRIGAISGVELAVTSSVFSGEKVEQRPFLHRVEDPIGGNDYHILSAESLDLLVPKHVGGSRTRLAIGLINSLAPSNLAKWGVNSYVVDAVAESSALSDKLDSRSRVFIVAERIDRLLNEERALRRVPDIGEKSIELLKAAQQKTMELGIAQSDAPLGSMSRPDYKPPQDILIEELDFGVRAYNCLKRRGIGTEADLLGLSERQLDAIPFLGQRTKSEIMDKLEQRGRSLATEK